MASYRNAYREGDFRNRLPIRNDTPAEHVRLRKLYRKFSFKKKGDDRLRHAVEFLYAHFEKEGLSYTYPLIEAEAYRLAKAGELDLYWLTGISTSPDGADKREAYLKFLEKLEKGEAEARPMPSILIEIQELLLGKYLMGFIPKKKKAGYHLKPD